MHGKLYCNAKNEQVPCENKAFSRELITQTTILISQKQDETQ